MCFEIPDVSDSIMVERSDTPSVSGTGEEVAIEGH